MWKVIESVDLKCLEDFGYLDMGNCYQHYGYWGEVLFIDKETREITRVHPYDLREIPTADEISVLIEMKLVEKCEKLQ